MNSRRDFLRKLPIAAAVLAVPAIARPEEATGDLRGATINGPLTVNVPNCTEGFSVTQCTVILPAGSQEPGIRIK